MKIAEIYAAITEKIIANLETSGSWKKMWNVPSPVSLNGRYYRGVNRLVLSTVTYKSRVYGTFQQIRSNGGMVRKGEKATTVVFWKKTTEKDEITGKQVNKFLLRLYYVFNTDQADFDQQGNEKIASLQKTVDDKVFNDTVEAQSIVDGYQNGPTISYTSNDKACYQPFADHISVPDIKYFVSPAEFYNTIYHEMGHSTGHSKRLNRFESGENHFGDEPYSKEELVAELCASYLTSIAHLELDYRNAAAYIRSWSEKLRDNKQWIVWAASRAEKAADLILGIKSSVPSESTENVEIEAPVLDSVEA